MRLYEIASEIKTLETMIEEVTTDQDGNPRAPTEEEGRAMLALVDEIQGTFAEKAERICRYRANLVAEAEAAAHEADRLARIRKAAERKADSLKWLLESAMVMAGIEKADAGTFKLGIQRNPPSVFISQISEIPAEFFRIVPEVREPDKKKLLDALREGQKIPGAILSQSSSLRIR